MGEDRRHVATAQVDGTTPLSYLTVLHRIERLALILISLTRAVNLVTAGMDAGGRLKFDRACRVVLPSALVVGLLAILAPVL